MLINCLIALKNITNKFEFLNKSHYITLMDVFYITFSGQAIFGLNVKNMVGGSVIKKPFLQIF